MPEILLNLTEPYEVVLLRENDATINIPVTEDYTTKAIKFVVKADSSLGGLRVIEKNNFLGGGSDSEILVTPTNIAINIIGFDTYQLETKKWYFDIKNTDDDVTIAWGLFILKTAVQSSTDQVNNDEFILDGGNAFN